jgi:LPPG:FO 2-phospho-L-lactate transferase
VGVGTVVLLSGGTGGAKLARGMLDVVGDRQLAVVANTGDDIDIYGAHVSPDPDLIAFWLADLIDSRGWGLRGDTFCVMDALRELGVEVWFQLGDRDLAWCLERTRMERAGARPTEALRALCERIGVRTAVLPMCDLPLRTFVGELPIQQVLIKRRGEPPPGEVTFRSPDGRLEEGRPPASPEVLAALARARVVIVGPSNPVISIRPILEVLGDALATAPAPVVAVSPVVAGAVLKGPTDAFLAAAGLPTSAAGALAYYERVRPGLLDGIVADEPLGRLPPGEEARAGEQPRRGGIATLQIDTRMDDAAARARVAEQVLRFAESLSR